MEPSDGLENIKCSRMYEIRNVTGPWGNTINILQHLAQPTLNQEMCEKAYLCHKCLLLNNLCFCSMKTKKARSCGLTVDPSSTKFVKVN